jgi:[protein-PII] uridylyltransferase
MANHSATDVMDITKKRTERAADDSLVGRALCRTWATDVDTWLRELFDGALKASSGTRATLVAVGGYGRSELSLQSDLDVLLLHAPRSDAAQVARIAERVWYPIWDAGIKLGHAVRTVDEAMTLAASDIDTATSLLDARHLAGDAELAATLAERARMLWRKRSRRFLARMAERVRQRHASAGEVAFLLEPDLKEGRGGLRDVQALRWAQAARAIMWDADDVRLDPAYDLLLAARVELHRRAGRAADRLVLQEQDALATALGYRDADDLMRAVAGAGQTIAWISDDAWARIESALAGPLGRVRRERSIGTDLLLRDGHVHVAAGAHRVADPSLPLRAAAAAAARGTRLDRASLTTLAAVDPDLPEPWPAPVRSALVDLLLAGPPAVPVLEALDQHGIWERYFVEWSAVRAKPQRNAYHRFTVDRHLWETATQAARLAGQVERPDLLVLAGLLHDIGKGWEGDHTANGVGVVGDTARRLGFDAGDATVLVALCRHHLLLADVATRRDLDEPRTIDDVARAVGSLPVLELLAALTEADSLATGPAAWSTWKSELVRSLVVRVRHVLTGGHLDDLGEHGRDLEPFPTAAQRGMLAASEQAIVADQDRLTVVCPDRHGLFARVAGTLALHGLNVCDAVALTEQDRALEVFRVESTAGPAFSWQPVLRDLERALHGRLALDARLADRVRRYGHGRHRGTADFDPEVRFDVESAENATVVEVHAADGVTTLYRITRALADLDLDIVSAKVQALGSTVVASFYVHDSGERKVTDDATLTEIERAILHALDQ